MGWRARLELAPFGVLFVFNCVLYGGWVLVLSASDHDDWPFGEAVIFVLVMAFSITGLRVLQRRWEQRVAGTKNHDDWTEVVRALWTGDAPADTSFDGGLQTLAAKRLVNARRMPWVLSVVTALILIVTISVPNIISIVLTCAFGLLSLLYWRERVQLSPRLARLTETLRSRSAHEATAGRPRGQDQDAASA